MGSVDLCRKSPELLERRHTIRDPRSPAGTPAFNRVALATFGKNGATEKESKIRASPQGLTIKKRTNSKGAVHEMKEICSGFWGLGSRV